MANEISVVICAYTEKRWQELVAAVASVQHQTLPPKEIIIVIDHNPTLLQRVRSEMPQVIVLENRRAKGASGSRNTGAAAAQGTILAFLDDDATAHRDWLESLAACYTQQKRVGVGGKIEPHWIGKHPRWFPDEFNWVIGCSYQGLPTVDTPVRNVIGANMSVRKEIFTQVGGFREAFGCDKGAKASRGVKKWFQHYAGDEETELCVRVSQQHPAHVWLYTPYAVVQHRVSPDRTRLTYFLWRCYDEGLGKASLVKLHNSKAGLASEKSYTLKTLPKGVARGLADTFLYRDIAGVLRACVIVIGLTMTSVGYLAGVLFSGATDAQRRSVPDHLHTIEIPPPIEAHQ